MGMVCFWSGTDFFGHNAGIYATHLRQLHLVFVTIGAVQAMQQENWAIGRVKNQATHRQQSGSNGHLQLTRHLRIGLLG